MVNGAKIIYINVYERYQGAPRLDKLKLLKVRTSKPHVKITKIKAGTAKLKKPKSLKLCPYTHCILLPHHQGSTIKCTPSHGIY